MSQDGLREDGIEEPLTIEQTFTELDRLLEMLERQESSLGESFLCFERGMRLVRRCSAQIDKVEKQILVLSEEENHEGL